MKTIAITLTIVAVISYIVFIMIYDRKFNKRIDKQNKILDELNNDGKPKATQSGNLVVEAKLNLEAPDIMDDIADYVYPITIQGSGDMKYQTFGLSKREHFASMAMQGMLSNEETSNYYNTDTLTEFAVEYADLLIAELNKEDKQ